MAWSFLKRREGVEVAPDFFDALDREAGPQLEKSCGRTLPFHSIAAVSGEPVRQFYMQSVDLQGRYPLGLLPVGQKRLAKWLLKEGKRQHDLSDEQIIAFLFETATYLPRGIVETYLICPEWQARFSEIEASDVQRRLAQYLQSEFPGWAALRRLRASHFRWPAAMKPDRAGVNLLAHFCYPSGLQQGALATKAALEAAGLTISCRDIPAGKPDTQFRRETYLGFEVFPVSILQLAPMPFSQTAYARAGLHRRAGVYRIAYWSWELDAIPPEWPSFEGVMDEIWTPSDFVSDAMRRKFSVPVFTMPHALALPAPTKCNRSDYGIAEDHFVFLFMFDVTSEVDRKNPLGLIRAFRLAFPRGEKATLLLKV
ncbi:MAG: hypothetical protein M3Z32_11020, partial [Acidobacteriota bacterium]|nr:hypothetical protein [Acidobacteriota bacterium]